MEIRNRRSRRGLAPRRSTTTPTSTVRGLDAAGFTLIEMMVALLILGIVLAATAPALYGALKGASTSNLRSVANGIAVKADEQMRSLPYYELGFHNFPVGCTAPTGTSAVTLAQNGPMDSFRTTQTDDGTTFSIQRCAYWVGANDNANNTYTGAYVETTVTVSWRDQTGNRSVSHTSAIYPGGEGAYSYAYNPYAPQSPPSTAGTAPSQPTGVTFGTIRNNSVAVAWTAPSTATRTSNYSYLVEYNTTGIFDTTQIPTGLYAYTTTTNTNATITGLSPGSTYYFQVVAVNQGTSSAPSNLSHASTTGTPASGGTCTIYSMTLNPTQAQINTYGYLQTVPFFTVGMSVSPGCTNGNSTVWAYFPTTSSTLQNVQLAGTGPMLTAAAGLNSDGSQMAWTPGNKTFTAYSANGASPPAAYSPSTFVQVNICQPSPITGSC